MVQEETNGMCVSFQAPYRVWMTIAITSPIVGDRSSFGSCRLAQNLEAFFPLPREPPSAPTPRQGTRPVGTCYNFLPLKILRQARQYVPRRRILGASYAEYEVVRMRFRQIK